ncbi:unnamed protein product [Lathyrus sativus]|nr:unnamed protein product [Lathyrus sativus]
MENPIYSKIDRVIGNLAWHQSNVATVLNVMENEVSKHALLVAFGLKDVNTRWNTPIRVTGIEALWRKLRRL